MNLGMPRGESAVGKRSWGNQEVMGFKPQVWCGPGLGDGREEGGAVSAEAHGGEDPCGMVPHLCEVGSDIFSAEGIKSWRHGQVRSGSLAEYTVKKKYLMEEAFPWAQEAPIRTEEKHPETDQGL